MDAPLTALSRRRFLQLAAAASASLAAPGRLWAAEPGGVFDDGTDAIPGGLVGDPERVIVVGAGFAGLAAANALANAGVEVVVLESRMRIGGRAWTRDVGGIPVDQGCQWIHSPIGNPLTRWAQLLGVGSTPADYTADLTTFTAYEPQSGRLTTPELVAAFFQTLWFDQQAPGLLAALGPRATVEHGLQRFLEQNAFDPALRRRVEAAIRLIYETGYAAPVNDLSLDALFGDSPDPPDPPADYSGSDVFPVGGYRELFEPLARGLDVRLGHAVSRIEYGPDGVVVRAVRRRGRRPQMARLRGSHVLVTLPLGVLKAGSVDFAPLLPITKVRSIQRLGVGYLEKVTLAFDEPFWQRDGGTHVLYNSTTPGEFPVFLDLQHFSGGPVLVGFVGGDFGRRMSRMPRGQIQDRVLEMLGDVFGPVPRPRRFLATRWFRDPNTRGSYSAMPVGAGNEDFDSLAAPVGGRVLFAGEATHLARSATADGAFSSGIREAKRLLARSEVRLQVL